VIPTATLPESDLRFLAAVEACQVAPGTFQHREHLRLAYIYLRLHPFEAALQAMRAALHRLLTHLEAPASAYHETITRAWLLAVAHFMNNAAPSAGSEEFLAGAAVLLQNEIMLTHYRPETLRSPAARARFIAPDLEPIPDNSRP
jgi:hypothetical protein